MNCWCDAAPSDSLKVSTFRRRECRTLGRVTTLLLDVTGIVFRESWTGLSSAALGCALTFSEHWWHVNLKIPSIETNESTLDYYPDEPVERRLPF